MEFYEHLKSYLTEQEIEQLKASLANESKHAILLNLRKMNDAKFLSLFPDVIKHPLVPHAYLFDKNKYELGKSIYHDLGCYYIQEPSAMIPSYLLSPNKGETILDLCAAPGGKSVQASFLMENEGAIISNDLSRNRCNAILENVERLGIVNITITNNDFSKIYQRYINYFDRIILDAPCSGSGMFRKEDKMMMDWSYNKVLKFQEIQKELILHSYQMLKPGGTMVYSTCSFSYEEDEEIIKYLLESTDATLLPIENNPLFYINKKEPLGIHLFPFLFPGEGHYICLIKKPGILTITNEKEKKGKDKPLNNYYLLLNNAHMHTAKYGDFIFSYPKEIRSDGLNIVRKGVKVGQLIGQNMRYDYHFSHYVNDFTPYFDIDFTELQKYFRGETLPINIDKGLVMLRYDGINITITNSDSKMIKNAIPKGLRKAINK